MILKYLIREKREISTLLIHILLGFLSLFTTLFFVLWFYLVLVTNITSIINNSTRSKTILLFSGYFLGLEIIGRMIRASPFVPYQIGIYFMLLVFSYGIIKTPSGSWGYIGKIILLLCIPGFYMIPYGSYLAFFLNSFSGILCLGLGAVYFGAQSYTSVDLRNFIKITVLPIITIVIYISIKSPSFNDIDFTLSSNFETSGGFGSNQVSTILGLGACLLILPFLRKEIIFSSYKFISIILIGVFTFRGLLTFSRGGILGALLAATLSYLYLNWKLKEKMYKTLFQILLVSIGCFIIFTVTNRLTGGTLSERYKGETARTLSGNRTRNLNTITSNRIRIALAEWDIFSDNVLLGVGPGSGYDAREKYLGIRIASHTEFTRLLAEQGIPGLLIGLIFIFYPLLRIRNSKSVKETYYLIGFFALAVITSFHSAMRTMITPLFWALSCARFSFPGPLKVVSKVSKGTSTAGSFVTHEENH